MNVSKIIHEYSLIPKVLFKIKISLSKKKINTEQFVPLISICKNSIRIWRLLRNACFISKQLFRRTQSLEKTIQT